MSGIGVVVNPRSRGNLRDPDASAKLGRCLGDRGMVREARTLDDLRRIAEEFCRREIDVLAISGGDGTSSVTLTGMLEVYGPKTLPPVALLRGGTMNTLAGSIGIPRWAPEKLLGSVLGRYACAADPPFDWVERDVMSVRALDGGKARCAFLFGTGVVYGFLSEYYAAGAVSPWVAAATLARGIASAFLGGELIRRISAPFRGTVTLNGAPAWPERDYLAVAAGTIPHIGLGFQPFYRFAERPGAFHALGIHASPAAFVMDLPRIRRASPLRGGKAYDAVCDRMLVQSADRPLRYTLDGDLHEAREAVEVSVAARVRLVRGPKERADRRRSS